MLFENLGDVVIEAKVGEEFRGNVFHSHQKFFFDAVHFVYDFLLDYIDGTRLNPAQKLGLASLTLGYKIQEVFEAHTLIKSVATRIVL